MLECKLCKKKLHRMKSHLWNTHKMTTEQYKNLFGDTKFVSDELSAKLNKIALNHMGQNALNLSKSNKRRKEYEE